MDIAATLDEAIDLEEQGLLSEALLRFEKVLAAEPRNEIARAGALGARAAQACHDGRYDLALELCNAALAASTYDLRALTVRARAFLGAGRPQEALADCLRVLTYAPDFPEALATRGAIFIALGETEAGVSDLEAAAALKPDTKFLLGQALHFAMHLCRWDRFQQKLSALLQAVEAGKPATRPFWLLSLPATPAQQKAAAAIYFADTVTVAQGARPRPASGGKLRLGYFSHDFYTHATAHLAAGLFEAHDRSRFEVIGFDLAGRTLDPMRMQLARSMDKLIDCAARTDDDILALARAEGLHIALDINVHIGRQPALFARGLAPVQVNYLGYPGTAAAGCYDYIIGDPVLTPFAHRENYSERIVQLPHCYQPNAFPRYGALAQPSRRELQLPESGFVFCCFNDAFKIMPDQFALWMDLLRAVEGSVLWLLGTGAAAAANLRNEATRRGIAPERLIFAPRVPIGQHLARHRAADLFLDTFPYNAHTTASDALWAGLPLLTRAGETFPSRVAASVLVAAGLPDMVTASAEEYAARALALARDPALLAEVRARLAARRSTTPLFDTARYTRNIERAYAEMWARHNAGMPPREFAVTDPA